MSITEHKITVDSQQWFYRLAEPIGRTDLLPILLLHGLVSQSYSWRKILPALAQQGTKAIAPDWIGFGFSSKPEKRDFAYTPDAFITALERFIQALELERFSLVVQGFLGSVGLQYALRHPEQIANIVILNTPISSTAKLPWKIQQMGLPLAGEMMTQDPLLVDRTLEGGSRYVIPDKDLDVYRQPFLKTSAAGRALLSTIRNLQLAKAMSEIETGFKHWQQPILIQWGVIDPWLNLDMAENFAKSVPNGKLVKLNNVGHYPQEHYHETILEDLLPFVRRAESS
ncbi:hydrolase [Fischerella thermalis CCMEE 5273]|jgi:pimeloyl-ACP methyl ester carboxylesterase|uniref:Alpha/beta hydrolase fold protein n=1 Tax=Fischerella thermalis JSC-11 TaxID=741277 RepID=G6FW91_9CYAN|nr:alpha/beta fold hydrolase [Fischerella thermalis]PMB05068.1 hydrolase [Fischerella thermalis CCMEE 5328]PMB06328.1 hydrolase [Fischerella thermalis CCMEE 5273]EHC11730.1 alpha/beta hydrolase fold protein [Fischerella thermalis JSC-11]MBF1988666.1 alpha/beta fold hydrolase [Fischerella thermalis M58_A2018_009]MBF2062653.1 alpha/beta fold hydrolase [Fischerella thermalis M66_A2018_004]